MHVILLKRLKYLAGTCSHRCHQIARTSGSRWHGPPECTCVSLTPSVLHTPGSVLMALEAVETMPEGCKCIRTDLTVPMSPSAIGSNQTMVENYYYGKKCVFKA